MLTRNVEAKKLTGKLCVIITQYIKKLMICTLTYATFSMVNKYPNVLK